MGREIRCVPADWEHPRYTSEDAPHQSHAGHYRPLFDDDFESAAETWEAAFDQWRLGRHPDRKHTDEGTRFWEWDGPPDREYYRERCWTEAEATHFQVYETVSEGTPVTPHFATKAELVDYLVKYGDFWDQRNVQEGRARKAGWSRKAAEAFVEAGDHPSMIVVTDGEGAGLYESRDGFPVLPPKVTE